MWTFFHKLASPPHFYRLSARMMPWFAASGVVLILYGSVAGLFFAPPDYQQGDAFRIIYVHVPAAYLSMMAYMVMAIAAAIGLIWRMKLAHAVAAGALRSAPGLRFLRSPPVRYGDARCGEPGGNGAIQD
jgi:heme exporter protein C